MRLRLSLVAVAAALCAAAGASSAAGAPAAAARTCHHGYVHATLSWGERCLRSGQYCKKVRNPEYHTYGFQCVNGQLRKQTGLRKGTTK